MVTARGRSDVDCRRRSDVDLEVLEPFMPIAFLALGVHGSRVEVREVRSNIPNPIDALWEFELSGSWDTWTKNLGLSACSAFLCHFVERFHNAFS